jgi:cell division protease FtsH
MDDISTGASADIRHATEIAHDMVTRYGMSERLGTVNYGDDNEVFVGLSYGRTKPYSEQTAGKIDDEVRLIIDRAYEQCERILKEHDDRLEAVAAFLLEHDTMTRTQFIACMKGEEIPETESESIFDRFAELEKQEHGKKEAPVEIRVDPDAEVSPAEPREAPDAAEPQEAPDAGESPAEEWVPGQRYEK